MLTDTHATLFYMNGKHEHPPMYYTRAMVAHACAMECGAYRAYIIRDNGDEYDIAPDAWRLMTGREEWMMATLSGLSQGDVDNWVCFKCFMNFTGDRCTTVDPYVEECSFWW